MPDDSASHTRPLKSVGPSDLRTSPPARVEEGASLGTEFGSRAAGRHPFGQPTLSSTVAPFSLEPNPAPFAALRMGESTLTSRTMSVPHLVAPIACPVWYVADVEVLVPLDRRRRRLAVSPLLLVGEHELPGGHAASGQWRVRVLEWLHREHHGMHADQRVHRWHAQLL